MNLITKMTWTAIIAFTSTCGFAQKHEIETQKKIKNIENSINNTSLTDRMNFYKIPGVSIAVVNNFEINWAKAYGVINTQTKIPVTTATYFETGSVAKLFTAATALYFVEKGIIELDENVNKYLKSWKIPENEFTHEKKVTLRLLLTHRSGLPSTNFPYEKGKKPTLIQVLKGKLPAKNEAAVVEYIPGSDWEYSNIAYVVIQLLLEDITGNSFSEIVNKTVFEPLDLHSSTFENISNENLRAMPHFPSGELGVSHMHPSALAHGNLLSTSSDLALFTIELMKAYTGKSHKILSQNMVRQMFKSELKLDPAIFGGVPFNQGLGTFLQGEGESLFFGLTGDNYPGATAFLGGIPKSGKGILIMTNGAAGLPLALEIFEAVKKEYDWPNYIEDDIIEENKETGLNGEEIEFVLVKGGEYMMGNSFKNKSDPDELPRHSVKINDFYMGATEVTNYQYDKFCIKSGRAKPKKIPGMKQDNMPAMKISWHDAQAFCEYYGYRLPTEAEWEYAAKEGGKNNRFANGKDTARYTEINFNAKKKYMKAYSETGKFRRKPVHVKSFPPNALGFYEMSGNLAEWCQDKYSEEFYENSPKANPLCKESIDNRRIIRGGHLFSSPYYVRCTHREARIPETKNFEFGFRVVKDIAKDQ